MYSLLESISWYVSIILHIIRKRNKTKDRYRIIYAAAINENGVRAMTRWTKFFYNTRDIVPYNELLSFCRATQMIIVFLEGIKIKQLLIEYNNIKMSHIIEDKTIYPFGGDISICELSCQ